MEVLQGNVQLAGMFSFAWQAAQQQQQQQKQL
jgi:hypothetical protein